jgi:hypothetical protein
MRNMKEDNNETTKTTNEHPIYVYDMVDAGEMDNSCIQEYDWEMKPTKVCGCVGCWPESQNVEVIE